MKDQDFELTKKLLDQILKIDRNELRELRNWLAHSNFHFEPLIDKKSRTKSQDYVELIGSLPFVLLDKRFFPDNKTLVMFSEKNLEIKIPFAPKRSRNEIIGTIIAEVSKKNQNQISLFTTALNKLLKKQETGKIKNFFSEWEKVIQET